MSLFSIAFYYACRTLSKIFHFQSLPVARFQKIIMVVIAMHNRICTYRCSISHTMKLFCVHFSYAYVSSTALKLHSSLPVGSLAALNLEDSQAAIKVWPIQIRPGRKICATQSGRQEITLMVCWFRCQHKFTCTYLNCQYYTFYH